MPKNALIAVVVVVGIALAGYLLFTYKAAAPATDMTATSTPEMSGDMAAESTLVSYTDAGFSPKDVTVSVGETVRFVNTSSNRMWVASDEHPTHTDYDGTSTREHCADGVATNGTFDQC